MKIRIAALVALLSVIAIVIAIGGWWYVKDRQRIGQAELQSTVAAKAGGSGSGSVAICEKKDANAAHWLCLVTTAGASPRCMRAHVRPWGSVDLINAYRKCSEDPQLAPLAAKATKATTKQGA
jgi:hypothetical protein